MIFDKKDMEKLEEENFLQLRKLNLECIDDLQKVKWWLNDFAHSQSELLKIPFKECTLLHDLEYRLEKVENHLIYLLDVIGCLTDSRLSDDYHNYNYNNGDIEKTLKTKI